MRAICLLLLTILVTLAGCQTTTVTESPNRGRTRVEGTQQTDRSSVSADQAVASEPCAARLHDVAGALLLYYAVNKQLPPTLADLQDSVGADMLLDFTCPDSKLPYVYVPNGLRHPDRPKVIILHDPIQVKGKRWCILVQPGGPGTAQSLEVLAIPEPLFLAYQPVK